MSDDTCELVSRNSNAFTRWPVLNRALASALRRHEAILDGEVVCLLPDGRSCFTDLLFRRGEPFFYAFDLLWLDGEDWRPYPLLERKQRLARLVVEAGAPLLYVEHVVARGVDLYRAACENDLEGVVAKWARGRYEPDSRITSWLKVKNRAGYSQFPDRAEFFQSGVRLSKPKAARAKLSFSRDSLGVRRRAR